MMNIWKKEKTTLKACPRRIPGMLLALTIGVVSVFGLGSTASAFVLGPTTPGKWGSPVFGTGATVTWSLQTTGGCVIAESFPCSVVGLSTFMPAGFKAEVAAAFDAWSAVADITFMEVADSGLATGFPGAMGNIRVGGHTFDGAGGVLAHAFFPPFNVFSAAGDIHFDEDDLWKIGLGGAGFDIFTVAAHEIGHTIGLNHTTVPMSLLNPFYTEAVTGPQADDIAGAVSIYGEAVVAPIPEPTTLLLFGSGIIGLVAWRVRGKHTA